MKLPIAYLAIASTFAFLLSSCGIARGLVNTAGRTVQSLTRMVR
jgi:hypothetical protein